MKICSRCKKELNEDKFHKNKSKRDGLSDVCNLCSNEFNRVWYKNNKQHKINRTKIIKKERMEWLNEYKSELKCQVCGENDIVCLDFHHNNPDEKEYNISHMVSRGYSKERIMKEINKCSVLCANCHRKLHSH